MLRRRRGKGAGAKALKHICKRRRRMLKAFETYWKMDVDAKAVLRNLPKDMLRDTLIDFDIYSCFGWTDLSGWNAKLHGEGIFICAGSDWPVTEEPVPTDDFIWY